MVKQHLQVLMPIMYNTRKH